MAVGSANAQTASTEPVLSLSKGSGQAYPIRPLRIVVPYPPGGGTDVVARTLAQKMNEVMGQPVIVDNRAGANGIIGSEVVAKAAPDGYTVLITILNNFLAGAQMIKAGRLRALAVTSRNRSNAAPGVPTVAESGVPGYAVTGWYAMMVPAATPAPVLRTLHEATVKSLKSKEISGRLSAEAAEIIANTPQEFAAFLKTESEKWTAVIRKAKVRIAE